MIDIKDFFSLLYENEIEFFTGVPDSLLKSFSCYLDDNSKSIQNIIAANEGNAIGIAAGYHMATNKIPLVYMQNSGLCNALNPLISLIHKNVYSIPILLVIGWRGEPNVNDEPQHKKQGEITLELLKLANIKYEIIDGDIKKLEQNIEELLKFAKVYSSPVALIVKKNVFEKYVSKNLNNNQFKITREEAIKKIVDSIKDKDFIVSSTGKLSRELYEYRIVKSQEHDRDFLTVGSMGHASSIALGISLNNNNKIFCIDGDGALIMHMGALVTNGILASKNYKHILLNNGSHETVGGQKTFGLEVNIIKIAAACGFKNVFEISEIEDFENTFKQFYNSAGPSFLEIKVNLKSRNDLLRPKESPVENKKLFMQRLSIVK